MQYKFCYCALELANDRANFHHTPAFSHKDWFLFNLAISVLMDVRETLFQDHHPKGYLFC